MNDSNDARDIAGEECRVRLRRLADAASSFINRIDLSELAEDDAQQAFSVLDQIRASRRLLEEGIPPRADGETGTARELAAYRRAYGCLGCGERHPEESICPPHEVRTTGEAWLRQRMLEAVARAVKAEKRAEEAERAAADARAATDGASRDRAFLETLHEKIGSLLGKEVGQAALPVHARAGKDEAEARVAGETFDQDGHLIDRLRRLAVRREDEGIYTDRNIAEQAAARLEELLAEVRRRT